MHPLFRAIPSQFAKGCRRHLLLVLPVLALAASLGACALREPLQADNGEAAAPAGNAADETAPAPSSQADRSPQQREFHYDFVVPGHSRDELWHAATAYFSLGMGVNRPKFDKLDDVIKAYDTGKCDTFAADVSQLYAPPTTAACTWSWRPSSARARVRWIAPNGRSCRAPATRRWWPTSIAPPTSCARRSPPATAPAAAAVTSRGC